MAKQTDTGQKPARVGEKKDWSEVAKELLIKSDVNQVGKNGETALVLACTKGDLVIVKMLLEQEGIDINTDRGDGVTVFALSLKRNEEITKLLLRQADLEIKDDIFVPPLQIASSKGQVDIVKELIRLEIKFWYIITIFFLYKIRLQCRHKIKIIHTDIYNYVGL